MTNNNEWYRLLTLSQKVAAIDLETSNELLKIADDLINLTTKNEVTPDKIDQILKLLLNRATILTNSSRDIGLTISKLVGTT